tara:strand:- start:28874 stop:29605 length:732 start_codon:yes stop_codon:yes gene_type:complete
MDLLKFSSIIKIIGKDGKTSEPTGFSIEDLYAGKINWPENDLQDLKEWLNSNAKIQPWLSAQFNKAKLIVDPVILSHPFPTEDSSRKAQFGQGSMDNSSAGHKRLKMDEPNSSEIPRKGPDPQKSIEQKRKQPKPETKKAKDEVEEKEFQELVAEIKNLGFTQTSQVSNYIVTNQLGYKYPRISGVLQMGLNGTVWDFSGGFPPRIYARLCEELDLSNNGTRAKPIAFESFDRIERRSRKRRD